MKKFYIIPLLLMSFLIYSNSLSSQDFKTLLNKGIQQYRQENYEEALDIFKKAYSINNSNTILNYFIGITYRAMEKYYDSIKYLLTAVTKNPKIKEALPELIDSYYRTNQYTQAEKWIKIGEKLKIFPAKIQFLKGMVYSKIGKLKEAIKSFNKAKSYDKNLAQICDFQIAAIYIKMNKNKQAIDKLKSVIAYNPTTDIATFARDYIQLVQKKMAFQKNWKFNLGIMYKYDTNVVLKPTSSITGLDISDKNDNAITTYGGITFIAPFTYTTPFSLNINYNFFYDNYFSLNSYDTFTNTIGVSPGYKFKKIFISLPMSYNYAWVAEKEYMEQINISPSFRFLLNLSQFIDLKFIYQKKNYFTKTLFKQSDRDSKYYGIGSNYFYFFKKGNGLFNLSLEYGKENADGEYWDKKTFKSSGSFLYPIFKKLKIQLSMSYQNDNYDNKQPSIGDTPGTMKKRNDNIYTPTAGIIYSIKNWANLVIQYTYIYSDSNIPIYKYRKQIYTIGFEFRW